MNFGKYIVCSSAFLLLIACQQPQTEDTSTATTSKTDSRDQTDNSDSIKAINKQEAMLVKKMSWLNEADPETDARNSLAQIQQGNKPELIAFSNRMLSFPGLTPDQYASIKDQVSYMTPDGSGDMLLGEEHHKMQKKLFAYAETYNKAIFNKLAAR